MSALFDERTIKFKIRFKVHPLQAILKVPQRMFNTEPFSEYGCLSAVPRVKACTRGHWSMRISP